MAKARLLTIADEGGEAISEIGVFDGGLFFGGLALVRQWFAVLHRFDADGNHAGSDVVGCGPDPELARRRLTDLVAALGPVRRQDIAVRLFAVRRDGTIFGLVSDVYDDGEEYVDLLPTGIRFDEPWDGLYSS
ncbi:hypothetical protein [Actinoplanes subglobosus]|uniref:Uncharacterized protein n=1 Tax=Actinoplanes subglobosus TaxID=1547892 RepID=A0ABV8IZK4_9ACTN